METTLVYTAFGLAALTSLMALAFFILRLKLQDKVRVLEEKLTLEQARLSELNLAAANSKKKQEPSKPAQDNNKHIAELVELRKNNAHLKDEVKQLKQELRQSEAQHKEVAHRADNDNFKLRAENHALIERLRELETNSADKKRASSLETELSELRTQFKNVQSELNGATAKLKSERVAFEKQKQTLESVMQNLRELKAQHPEEPAVEKAKLDPKALERWKERALTARHMYQMMRQMRELSDLKLSTYQDAIVDVSRSLLELKGAHSPEIGPKENKADRLLAEAWSLVHPDTSPNA